MFSKCLSFPYVCVRASQGLLDVPFYAFLFFYTFVTAHLVQIFILDVRNFNYLLRLVSFVILRGRKGEEAVMLSKLSRASFNTHPLFLGFYILFTIKCFFYRRFYLLNSPTHVIGHCLSELYDSRSKSPFLILKHSYA